VETKRVEEKVTADEKKAFLESLDIITQCRMAIALCFFPNTGMRVGDKGAYRNYKEDVLIGGDRNSWLWIHPSSSLKTVLPKWVVYQELVFTSKPFIRQVCAIEYQWVEHLLPRLKSADIDKLVGRKVSELKDTELVAPSISNAEMEIGEIKTTVKTEQPESGNKVETARERYLQRKRLRETETTKVVTQDEAS